MKITSKGQLTIPQSLRVKHGLLEHSEVECIDHPKGVLVTRSTKAKTRGQRVLERLKAGGKIKRSTAHWLKLTRGEA